MAPEQDQDRFRAVQPWTPCGAGSTSQDFRHGAVAARVPEDIGGGVFANGVVILQTREIFALDFLSTATRPQQIVGRVVMPARSFAELATALRNVTLGQAARTPTVACAGRCEAGLSAETPVEDVYDQFKLSDKIAGGVFSDSVLIHHTDHEFALDFVCSLYPRAIVTARIFIPSSRMPQVVETVASALERYGRMDMPERRACEDS